MGNAIKCPACGLYYNCAVYNSCPHCSNSGAKKDQPSAEKNEEAKGLRGRFGWMRRSAEERHKKTPAPQQEPGAQAAETDIPAAPANMQPGTEALFRNERQPVQENTEKTDADPGLPLPQAISRSGRTVGKYFSGSGGAHIAPVVGWLVGVKGAYRGQSFQLKNGRNKIGRSHEMDVKLLNDESVSKASVAVIVFDSRAGEFSILPGESDSLCYVNDKAVYERTALSGYDEIEFGDAGLNKYVFIPFCGERFSWSSCTDPRDQ